MKRLHSDLVASEERDSTCFYQSTSPFPSPKRQCVAREFSASPRVFAPSPSSPFGCSPSISGFPQYAAFQPQPFHLNNSNNSNFGSPFNNNHFNNTATQPPDPSTLGRGVKRQLGYDGDGDENISANTNISSNGFLNNGSLFNSRPTNHDTIAADCCDGDGSDSLFCSPSKRRRCDDMAIQQQPQQQQQLLADPSSACMDTDTLPAASGNNGWLPEDLQMVPYGWAPGQSQPDFADMEGDGVEVIRLADLPRIYAPPSPLGLPRGAVGDLPSRALLPWNASMAAARRWAFYGQAGGMEGGEAEECAEEDNRGLLFVDEQELRQYQQQQFQQPDNVNGFSEEIYLYHPSRLQMAGGGGGLVDENNVPLSRFHCSDMT